LPIIGLLETAWHLVTPYPKATHEWLGRLLKQGGRKTRPELGRDAVALALAISVEFSQALTHVVDAFLDQTLQPTVAPLLRTNSQDTSLQLKRIIAQVLRITPPVPGVYRTSAAEVNTNSSGSFAKGDRAYLSFTEAGVDPSVFGPKAKYVDPTAEPEVVGVIAGEFVRLLGTDYLLEIIVPVIRSIFQLKNLQRVPGNSGKLFSFDTYASGTRAKSYLDRNQALTLWSTDLSVTYSE